MCLARTPWILLVFFGLLVLATRLPLAPGQLFTFDDVNLALSVGHYDVRISQPHPPGYPLFVMEMRVLSWLRIKRPESILITLALLGSILALMLAVFTGDRIFGPGAGFWGAVVLLFAPPFWHAGVTSALRIQLAFISLAVAGYCWRAWNGEAWAVRASAIALAIGAGIRPETGVLLFPLWAASAMRAPVDGRERGRALLWMAGTVMLWLGPAMIASGGPANFIRANLDYISDQASVSSGLFGATESTWLRTFYRLLVWVFSSVWALALPLTLAWRGRQGWEIGASRWAFLALWFLPAFAFALNVHVEDPGQTLIMGVVVALFGGYLIQRAIETVAKHVSRLLLMFLLATVFVMMQVWFFPNDVWRIQWIAVIAACLGIALKIAPVPNNGVVARWQMAVLILVPLLYTDYIFFYHHGWYYRGSSQTGVAAAAEQAWADINTGFALTSLEQIENTLAVDDRSVKETRRLAAERPGNTVVVWERGLTAWRKIGYYAPTLPVYVLEHKNLRGGTPPVIVAWRGASILGRRQGAEPLRLDLSPGMRVVWLLNPQTEFHDLVTESFPVIGAGPVLMTDLPAEHGSRRLGEYEIAW